MQMLIFRLNMPWQRAITMANFITTKLLPLTSTCPVFVVRFFTFSSHALTTGSKLLQSRVHFSLAAVYVSLAI